MPSKKIESWSEQWRSAGYRNEPGAPVKRSGDELLQEDLDEVQLTKADDVETITTNSTRVGHHDNHPRTSSASFSRTAGVLRIQFSHGVRTYHVSEDQWTSFKSASEAGGVGQWIDANLPR